MYFEPLVLTFTAILIAILSLWVQLVSRQAKDQVENDDERGKEIIRLRQFWIYLAILIAMIAFGLFLLNMAGNKLYPPCLSCVITSVGYQAALGLVFTSYIMWLASLEFQMRSAVSRNKIDAIFDRIIMTFPKRKDLVLISFAFILALFSALSTVFDNLLYLIGWLSIPIGTITYTKCLKAK